MTPRQLLAELAGIAVLCIAWSALTLLMIERDRKRMKRRARYRTADRFTADSSGAGEPGPAATLNEESRPARRPEERTDARQS